MKTSILADHELKLIRQRAKRGYEFLKDQGEDPATYFNPKTLEMDFTDKCLLAQRAGYYRRDPEYTEERDRLGLDQAKSVTHGFDAPDFQSVNFELAYYRELEKAWLDLILGSDDE